MPNAFALEYHAREVDWWDDLHTSDPLIEEGSIEVPEEPGLGIDLDTDTVAEHVAPGEEAFDLD